MSIIGKKKKKWGYLFFFFYHFLKKNRGFTWNIYVKIGGVHLHPYQIRELTHIITIQCPYRMNYDSVIAYNIIFLVSYYWTVQLELLHSTILGYCEIVNIRVRWPLKSMTYMIFLICISLLHSKNFSKLFMTKSKRHSIINSNKNILFKANSG